LPVVEELKMTNSKEKMGEFVVGVAGGCAAVAGVLPVCCLVDQGGGGTAAGNRRPEAVRRTTTRCAWDA